MTEWAQNGHATGEDEALDDATVEELLAGRYQGEAADLLAVSQFLAQERSLADGPAPPPSPALAAMLRDPATARNGAAPTTNGQRLAELHVRPFRPQTGSHGATAVSYRARSTPGLAVAVASVVVVLAVVSLGSVRLLPGPTQNLVASVVRTVTPFDFPEQRQPQAGPKAPSQQATPSVTVPNGSPLGDPAPRTPESATNGRPPVAPDGADSRTQPSGPTVVPTTGTSPPRAAPTVPRPNGSPPPEVTTTSAPPTPPRQRDFTAHLSGATGVHPGGDPDGQGTATLGVHPGRDELCLTPIVSGIAPVTFGHVHGGPIGAGGPVVASFGYPEPIGGSLVTCVPVSDQVIKKIRKDPGHYHVDVHTTEFPDGALRGQLRR